MNFEAMNSALQGLRSKYAVAADGVVQAAPNHAAGAVLDVGATACHLLPWRIERRFVELKRLVTDSTLEDVSTLRFASMSAQRGLEQLLYREVDLCEYLLDEEIATGFAVMAGGSTINVVASMHGGVNVSIECSAALPPGTAPLDRHEIIARRGVACDRVVDTQVPQDSIYLFGPEGVTSHTDTDAELFGFALDEVLVVRAALEVLKIPDLGVAWNSIHASVQAKVKAIIASDAQRRPVQFEGERA